MSQGMELPLFALCNNLLHNFSVYYFRIKRNTQDDREVFELRI